MSEGRHDLAETALAWRKLKDVTVALPILGLFLYLSPIPQVFNVPMRIAGVPLIFCFIYGMWIVLIVLSARLSARISRDDPDQP